MSNPRDTGRYDAFTDSYVDTNVRVDFAWGNLPMQPNDDRGEATLDPALDSHIIATSGYEAFPAFAQGAPYDDTIANVEVPNLVGLNTAVAMTTATNAGLQYSVTSDTTDGATELNDDKVKTQSPAAGTLVNSNSTVGVVLYNYVNPGNPIAGMSTTFVPGNWTLTPGSIVMYLMGRTVKPTVEQVIKVIENSNNSLNQGYNVIAVQNDDAYNTGGTAVYLTGFEKAFDNPDTNEGGLWKDYFA